MTRDDFRIWLALGYRFWSKVETTDDCWLWSGHRDANGYGRFNVDGVPLLAHRLSYEALVGPVPQGLELDHLCRVTSCLNPQHLEAVTHKVNMERSAPATRTHCKRGHELSGRAANGCRFCPECHRLNELVACPMCGGPMHRGCTTCRSCRGLLLVAPDALACTKCGEWKPDEEFARYSGKSAHRRRQRRFWCKACEAKVYAARKAA